MGFYRKSFTVAAFLCASGAPGTSALADVWTFETPSKNIQCTVEQEAGVQSDITCTIIDRSGPLALPRPIGCNSDWGHTFSMRERGPVGILCQTTDRSKNGFETAAYGVTGNFGGFNCHSSTQGLTCTNRDGNGFMLARQRQTVIGSALQPDSAAVSPAQPRFFAAPQPLSNAAAYLRDQQISLACQGRGGTISPDGLIQRDLTGDGNDDLIIDHSGISCNGPKASSLECGTQACSVNLYVREGRLLKLKAQFLGRNVIVGEGDIPAIHARGRENSDGAVYWTGNNFEWRQNPVAAGVVSSQPATPAPGQKFADYPPADTLKTAAQFPDFNGRDRAFRSYRTRIREGVSAGVNFAGHYSFVTVGCGTNCRFGYVVDLRTGEVFDFPYGGEEQYQMDLLFSPDSRLLKVRWKESWDSETCAEKDMLVEGTKWRILAERTVPADDGLCYYGPDAAPDQVATTAGPAETIASGTAPATTAAAQGINDDLKQHWLVTEQYLQTLGFDPGPVDGAIDVATIMAVKAFQKAYGLEAINEFPPQQFAVLEALAKAKTAVAEAPAEVPGPQVSKVNSFAPKAGPAPDANPTAQGARPEDLRAGLRLNSSPEPVRNELYPDARFRLIDGHAAFDENGEGTPDDYRAWASWMLANLPLAVPEIIEKNDELAVLYAHVLLTEAERIGIEQNLGLPFKLFLYQNDYQNVRSRNRNIWALSTAVMRHSQDLVNRKLDEFTRPSAMAEVRRVLAQKTSVASARMPLAAVQIYNVTLGEYDFASKSFPIEAIRGAGNAAQSNPATSKIREFAKDSYGLSAKIDTDVKEFPISLPMDPQAAKRFVDELAARRGDQYRKIQVGIFGKLNSVAYAPEDSTERRTAVLFSQNVSRIDFAMDDEFQEVIHRVIPDKLEDAEIAAAVETGQKGPATLYEPEYLVAAISNAFPDFLEAQGVAETMMQGRIEIEKADLESYGLDGNMVSRILRPEVVDGTRTPNSDDLQKYLSFLEGRKKAGLSREIILPLSVWVRQGNDGGKFIEPARPVDLVARGLNLASMRFGGIGSNTNYSGNAFAEPGRIVLPASSLRGKERHSDAPVFFSLKLDKSDTNLPLPLQGRLKEPATDRSGDPRPFAEEHYDGELRGHVVLTLEGSPTVLENQKNIRSGRAVILNVSLKRIALLDRGTPIRFDYDNNGPADAAKSSQAQNVDVPQSLFLDAETSDLLVLHHLPETVTDPDFVRMLLARWDYENRHRNINEKPVWGRFFEIGQPRPDDQAIQALLPSFRKWSEARAANLPETIRILTNTAYMPGNETRGFGTTFANPNLVNTGLMSCETEVRVMKGQTGTPANKQKTVENACAYIRSAFTKPSNVAYIGRTESLPVDIRRNRVATTGAGNPGRHGTVGIRVECGRYSDGRDDYCLAAQKLLKEAYWGKKVFALDDAYIFDKYAAFTDQIAAGTKGKSHDVLLTVKVTGIERSNRAKLSPKEMAITDANRFLVAQKIRDGRSGDFNETPEVVDMNFFTLEVQSATLYDRETHKTTIAFPLAVASPAADQALLTPVAQEKVETPTQAYGQDIVGLQLGMSFSEADRIIRDHMDVGRVITANGGWDSFEVTNQITPYTSGLAYESRDRKELIIIFDQPPSASKVVLGAVRQVAFEKGKVSISQVFSAARKKYGPAAFQDNGTLSWGDNLASGITCTAFIGARQNKNVWTTEDQSDPWPYKNSTFRGGGGNPPVPTNNETRSLEYKAKCGPGLTITFDTQENRDWDRLVFRLYDRKSYLDHLTQSEQMVRQGHMPTSEGAKKSEDLKIKF
ncbi:peptidoglycan-binding domain-containing protein [uncultured Roseibium sp.]|uniref:peptidoglycan-binding domain-containing protein n=1 Tax=uncultured Roseibium sp. TaxID=1936171 RepID=UPI00321740AE